MTARPDAPGIARAERRVPVELVYVETAIPPGMTIDGYRRLRPQTRSPRRRWLDGLLRRRKARGS